ncbi:MAG: DUF6677 family protein [Pirellulaceae bacterium]
MAEVVYDLEDGEQLTVDLREPHWAALLAWLWPGAGHFYQRRFAKGFLFMISVLSIYFLGLFWGTSRVVYASTRSEDFRWQYFCQAGVGIPAFPALIQAAVAKDGADPLWPIAERFPRIEAPDRDMPYLVLDRRSYSKVTSEDKLPEGMKPIKDGFMAAPGYVNLNENCVLGHWHLELGHFFEIGTLYTLIAGLLNVLAVYDAYVGPVIIANKPDDAEAGDAI